MSNVTSLGRVQPLFKGDYNNKTHKVPDAECKKNMQSITVDEVLAALDKQNLSPNL